MRLGRVVSVVAAMAMLATAAMAANPPQRDRRNEIKDTLQQRFRVTQLGPRHFRIMGDDNAISQAGGVLTLRHSGLVGSFDRTQIAAQSVHGDKVELASGRADEALPVNEKLYVNSVYVGRDVVSLGLLTVRNFPGKTQTAPLWLALNLFFDPAVLAQGDITRVTSALNQWVSTEDSSMYAQQAPDEPPAPPADLKSTMTRDQVVTAMGTPVRDISFGNRTWLYYPDMVVEMQDGKVAGVDRSAKPPAKVNVASDPLGADLMIDGNFVSSTPAVLQLPPGRYKVVVHLDGYQDWQRDLQVLSGAEINLSAHLSK